MLGAPIVLCVVAGLATPPQADSLVGKVRIAGTSFRRIVSLVVDDTPVRLEGDEILGEIGRLQSIVIEVIGKRDGERFRVASYRIIDVGGGAKPHVGTITRVADELALTDGSGASIALSLPPRNKRRLSKKLGAKAWVHGKMLVSGALEVLQYGILREPPKEPKAREHAPPPSTP